MQEPIIKVLDVAWIRLGAPDLDQAEKFLTDFGLPRHVRTEGALYMRGTGGAHHLHVTERGPVAPPCAGDVDAGRRTGGGAWQVPGGFRRQAAPLVVR